MDGGLSTLSLRLKMPSIQSLMTLVLQDFVAELIELIEGRRAVSTLSEELDSLHELDAQGLRARWRRWFRGEPPSAMSPIA